MIVQVKDNKQIYIRRLNSNDYGLLYNYLQTLSAETKKRFGPHMFDKEAIAELYNYTDTYLGYVGIDIATDRIIAYTIIKIGYLEHDGIRFRSYGLTLDNKNDCAFAPSVADAWQSCGIGNKLFQFVLADLKAAQIKRIILWGGVQLDNDKAVNYYKRNGFEIMGKFTYNGENYDMMLYVSSVY